MSRPYLHRIHAKGIAMLAYNTNIKIRSKGFSDCIDITAQVEKVVKESGVVDGLITIMIPGSTASITTIEYESGAINDLKAALDRIAPEILEYAHNKRWGDGNGFSHVRAAIMKPSLCVPVINAKLTLGTWQQIILIDFDNKPRTRSIILMIIGTERY
jgi:secondary thiamine-phosphate synthase enzyme